MKEKKLYITILIPILGGRQAWAAGIDCQKANSFREKTICQNKPLVHLDAEIAKSYKELLAGLDPYEKQAIVDWQKEWIQEEESHLSESFDKGKTQKKEKVVGLIAHLQSSMKNRLEELQKFNRFKDFALKKCPKGESPTYLFELEEWSRNKLSDSPGSLVGSMALV